MTERDDLAPVARLRSRFHGAFLGLAVADALATPAQWTRPGQAEPIRDLRGGGPHDLPRGAWRADTAMAWCTAASLLDTGHHDSADELARLRAWQREGAYSATGECIGITAVVAQALALGAPSLELAAGIDAEVRAVPITLFHFGDDAARERALVASTALTACTATKLAEVRALSNVITAALRGDEAAWSAAWVAALAVPEQQICSVLHPLLTGHDGWKAAALAAANLGGEAQGIPALVGALAGARYGILAIPPVWLESIAHGAQLRELADAMLVAALVEIAGVA